MKLVRLSDEAEEEAALAAEWYEDQRAGLGEDFLRAVRLALDELAYAPEACAAVAGLPDDTPARSIRVRGFPYRVIFTELAEILWIVSVAHDRRRPGYWSNRL